MPNTKNIIFDLGGVLLDIDYNRSTAAFRNLGIDNFEEMFSQFKADSLFEKLETGILNEAQFYSAIKKRAAKTVSDQEIENAWNALLLNFRLDSLSFLESLYGKYNLYLLSNTNSIHLKCFKEMFTKETGKPSLDDYFSKTWYSNEVGLRKPGAEIFKHALAQENLAAPETLFIDDTLINIETARRLGFKTYHLLPGEKIEFLNLNET